MTCSVVCISQATGSGGEEVGRRVAERLGFLYVNEELIAQAAARGGLEPGEVASEERRKRFAARVLDVIAEGGGAAWALGGAVPPQAVGELTGADIRALIRETVVQTAARRNVVIVAHAASHAIGQAPEALRVLITASPGVRAKRLGELEGLDDAGAARAVKDSDAARSDYLRRFYDVHEELPTHYDLVLNTDVLSVDEAAGLIAVAAAG